MSLENPKRVPHRDWHGTHHAWDYRPQAFRWAGELIAGANFVPFASEMHAWLEQRGLLSIISAEATPDHGGYTNPYTFQAGSLALILGRIVNSYHDYALAQSSSDEPIDAEIMRLRLYNEVLLYSARFCEVTIKQLLYCSQIPESRYKNMSLGLLLEAPCPSCKSKNGKQPHLVSLVGTLAHPFHLCLQFDHCAMDHMSFVNKLRNSQAAHSGIRAINIRTPSISKSDLLNDCNAVMSGVLHMLSHLSELEQRMLKDLGEKAQAINALKMDGLPPEQCNFKLGPGREFSFEQGKR